MLVVGLTGGIGAGKSTVAQFFSELGALVIDADQLARMAIERGTDGFDEVHMVFGEAVFTNGDIDRKKLAEVIFADESARKKLEAIIHPRVQSLFAEAVDDLSASEILVYEIPLLVETGAASKFDVVITVEAELELRKKRLLDRGMYISQIEKRIASQASREQREEVADFIVINDGDEDSLLRSVEEIWEQLQARSAQNPGAH